MRRLLLLEAGCLGVFLALDLFVFFVMFEIVLVPMYFLIDGWGYGERVYAADLAGNVYAFVTTRELAPRTDFVWPR